MILNLKRLFTNETIAHVGVLVFSAATILNVKEYLVYTEHSIEFSWVLSIALGIILVSMSFMLAASDKQSPAFKLKLISTLLLCLLSGTIQTLNYVNHNLHWTVATLFGYGFPIVAEMLLAMSVSLHHKEMKAKAAAHTEETIKTRISDSIAQSFEQIDVSDNKAFIEDQIKAVVQAQTSSIIAQLMPKDLPLHETKIEKSEVDALTKQIQLLLDELKSNENVVIGQSKEPIPIDDKYSIFLHHLETDYNNDVELVDKNQMALTLEVSKQSIYNYVKKYKTQSQKC